MPHAGPDTAPPLLLTAVAQFNRGEYFAQHETLEALWRAEPREVRRLYQGLLQIGVGLHHARRLNHRGAVSLLRRGLRAITPFEPACLGLDLAALHADASRALAAIEQLGPARLADFDWRLAPAIRPAAPPAGP